MHQSMKIIRKSDIEKQQMQILHLETDYLLLTLFQAMDKNDNKEIIQCKCRLKEIQDEVSRI